LLDTVGRVYDKRLEVVDKDMLMAVKVPWAIADEDELRVDNEVLFWAEQLPVLLKFFITVILRHKQRLYKILDKQHPSIDIDLKRYLKRVRNEDADNERFFD
jgi:hypothetical protein